MITDGTYSSLDLLVSSMEDKLFIPKYISKPSRILVENWVGYDISEVRPENLISKIEKPLLFIHGDKDWLAPPVSALNLSKGSQNSLPFWYDGTHDIPQNTILHQLVLSFIEIQTSTNNKNWKEIFMESNKNLYKEQP